MIWLVTRDGGGMNIGLCFDIGLGLGMVVVSI